MFRILFCCYVSKCSQFARSLLVLSKTALRKKHQLEVYKQKSKEKRRAAKHVSDSDDDSEDEQPRHKKFSQ